jgi:hypothetical protein
MIGDQLFKPGNFWCLTRQASHIERETNSRHETHLAAALDVELQIIAIRRRLSSECPINRPAIAG